MQSGTLCELCEREVEYLTRHHLIPRTRHKVYKRLKGFDVSILHRVVMICSPCHRNIHALLTEREMEREFNTIEKLRSHPEVGKYVEWIRNRPEGTTVPTRRSNSKGRKVREDD